jgi:hypothetical protein
MAMLLWLNWYYDDDLHPCFSNSKRLAHPQQIINIFQPVRLHPVTAGGSWQLLHSLCSCRPPDSNLLAFH